jgi:hypothetical protein
VTGNSLRTILADSLGIATNKLPSPRTLRRLLNRNGHVLRVTMTKQAFAKLNQALERKAGIDKWSVTIKPQPSSSAP